VTHPLLEPLVALHRRIRDDVVASCERAATATLSSVASDDAGDTIYAIDRVAEHRLVDHIADTIARPDAPVILVAEGLPNGRVVLPEGADPARAVWTIIVDPIDGTRGLMYQKRPGWILTGVARSTGNDGAKGRSPRTGAPSLGDIELAIQTEIPLVKQHLCDELCAVRGQGVVAARVNRLTGERSPLALHPSSATTLAHGFSTIARFFPGARAELAAIDDEIVETVLGPPPPGKAQLFEDQYISSGGQLYELMVGHDRFVADLRPLVERRRRPGAPALCCHPYDLCTELIARELGVVVTDEHGAPLDAPLDVEADVAWIGYANARLREVLEPALRHALQTRGLIA
jgi:Inositol monophosphatase family